MLLDGVRLVLVPRKDPRLHTKGDVIMGQPVGGLMHRRDLRPQYEGVFGTDSRGVVLTGETVKDVTKQVAQADNSVGNNGKPEDRDS